MAKAKNKTLVEKVLEGADKILHPENHETATQEQAQDMIDKGEATIPPEAEITSNPKAAYKSAMGKHKKFDKFN